MTIRTYSSISGKRAHFEDSTARFSAGFQQAGFQQVQPPLPSLLAHYKGGGSCKPTASYLSHPFIRPVQPIDLGHTQPAADRYHYHASVSRRRVICPVARRPAAVEPRAGKSKVPTPQHSLVIAIFEPNGKYLFALLSSPRAACRRIDVELSSSSGLLSIYASKVGRECRSTQF